MPTRTKPSLPSFAASLATSALLTGALLLGSPYAHAQSDNGFAHGIVFAPDTSVPRPEDVGLRTHTNHLILVTPSGGLGPGGGMTPAQIRSFYNMPSFGGAGVIAIVDAYDYPTAVNDFNVFSAQFGLPQETGTGAAFQVVYGTNGNKKPRANAGWAQEAALDIEWAHALAPNARIVLVEAASASYADLFTAVDKAKSLPGVTEVSMSWGGGEFSSEASYDSHFTNFSNSSNVAFFASSGDTGGVVEYPSCSPYVVAVGGTSVATDGAGNFTGETGWSGSGGGTSLYEAKPAYQSVLNTGKRAVPDISSDADPYTGVSVYDSTSYQGMSGWLVFGGTSVASPTMAGMHNVSGSSDKTSVAVLASIYNNLGTSVYRDITQGSAGSFYCSVGWDFVTGVGSPVSTSGF